MSRSSLVKMLSREVDWAKQCSDADGPRMPPDFVLGKDISHWPAADCAQEYNCHLLGVFQFSKSWRTTLCSVVLAQDNHKGLSCH